MAIFENTKAPTSLDQIEVIENLLNLKFPISYKNHLLANNGGQCTPMIFSFVERGLRTESNVDWFYAIYDGKYNNLGRVIQILKLDDKRLPTHMVPIAHDPGGNDICISCGMVDYGKVYFWDHEREVDYSVSDDSDYSNLYLIADSFDEFLQGLYDEPKY